jgi:cardiolipin synthase (CMP-forming)
LFLFLLGCLILFQSVLGSFLDPVADKVLVGTLTLTLGYKALLSPWLVGLIVLRDIGLIGGGFLIRHRTKPPGVPFFSTTHNDSFRLTPTFMGKVCGGSGFNSPL